MSTSEQVVAAWYAWSCHVRFTLKIESHRLVSTCKAQAPTFWEQYPNTHSHRVALHEQLRPLLEEFVPAVKHQRLDSYLHKRDKEGRLDGRTEKCTRPV